MSLFKINAALVTAYQALALDLPTAYEMRDFTPPASGRWARVLMVPSMRAAHTMGEGGEDNISGFFQIDVFVPENSGTGWTLRTMDAIHSHFHPGARFTYDGQVVRISRSSLTPARRDQSSASYRSTVTAYWTSATTR